MSSRPSGQVLGPVLGVEGLVLGKRCLVLGPGRGLVSWLTPLHHGGRSLPASGVERRSAVQVGFRRGVFVVVVRRRR